MSGRPNPDPIEEIKLDRHGLIEASAGTGKTYTIETLVVRLLKEEANLELENILLVTFTEKAASELKIRIREKIEAELRDTRLDPAILKKLRGCVDAFDRAAIHTIHGFCQSVLRDFAFENRAPFQSEVIPDAPLYETLLKEQMRKDWPSIYGDDLEEVLELSGFSEKKDDFVKTVIRLAMSAHAEAGDRIVPDLGLRDFREIRKELLSACMALKQMIGPNFSDRYKNLNFNAASRKSILEKIVVPVEKYFSALREDAFDLSFFSGWMAEREAVTSAGRKGLDCLIPAKWTHAGPNLQVCPELVPVKKGLEELRERLRELRCHLTAASVRRLQTDVALAKEDHGWISYYDMLAQVERAVCGEQGEDLLQSLRERFIVAFIDEFQDTDPVQWRIFRKIFIESPKEYHNRIFVIGDPKQAIYAFRGADVYAYLTARNEMRGLAEKEKASLYALSVNWRSDPRLITAFNRLFGRESWFKPEASAGAFEIGYQESRAPDRDRILARGVHDHSGRPVLRIVDLSDSPSPRPAKLHMARFVAEEIRRLVETDTRIEEKGRGVRSIGLGDMAILVRARSEVPFLEDALKRENIPYAFYKKPGLFASDEAAVVSLVFHAILDPGDASSVKKALLTPFFGRRVQDLYAYEELPPTHRLKEVLFQWNGYAMARRWGYLFQSLMEDSGLLVRGAGEIGWDRAYANYRQIFEFLKEVAYRKNLDFRGLSALLDLHRNPDYGMDEGVDIHQIETESDKVQIMTLHVSKGLQFPVVFVAGGLTQPPSHQEAYHVYHPDAGRGASSAVTRVFDLLKSGGDGKHELEQTDEDKRLYYVAATRAQFILYLPYYIYEKKGSWVGPVCTLLSPALEEAFPRDGAEKDFWVTPVYRGTRPRVGGQPVTRGEEGGVHPPVRFEDILIPENYEERRIRVDSFSSLREGRGRAPGAASEDVFFQPDREGREPDEGIGSVVLQDTPREGPAETLPGGTEVGLMFHGILEHMDYGVVPSPVPGNWMDAASVLLGDRATRDIIRQEMAAYRVADRWEGAVCQILWNTLTATVLPLGDTFTLASLKAEGRLHETAFYYSASGLPKRRAAMAPKGEAGRFVRGFIDLIFRKDGKYYVADWKSNLLESGYDAESLARSMAEANYHLQYKIYAVAALRWLRQSLGRRFDPERHWGGVFYFYIRGMGGTAGDGIWFVRPEEMGSLQELEAEVGSVLDP